MWVLYKKVTRENISRNFYSSCKIFFYSAESKIAGSRKYIKNINEYKFRFTYTKKFAKLDIIKIMKLQKSMQNIKNIYIWQIELYNM